MASVPLYASAETGDSERKTTPMTACLFRCPRGCSIARGGFAPSVFGIFRSGRYRAALSDDFPHDGHRPDGSWVLLAHGLVHLLYLASDVQEFSFDRSWVVPESPRRQVGLGLMVATVVAFALVALAVWDVPRLSADWPA